MKDRTPGFLSDKVINHESEQFDYIVELHHYLWRFVRIHLPGASGNLTELVDIALQVAEKNNAKYHADGYTR